MDYRDEQLALYKKMVGKIEALAYQGLPDSKHPRHPHEALRIILQRVRELEGMLDYVSRKELQRKVQDDSRDVELEQRLDKLLGLDEEGAS
jgi:hypothetical protein